MWTAHYVLFQRYKLVSWLGKIFKAFWIMW